MNTRSEKKRATDILERMVGPLSFAMFMRASRTTLGLNQSEMARKIGIKRSTLCDIEKGRTLVRPFFAAKYADKAGFSIQVAIEACLQDQLRKARLHDYEVQLKVRKN